MEEIRSSRFPRFTGGSSWSDPAADPTPGDIDVPLSQSFSRRLRRDGEALNPECNGDVILACPGLDINDDKIYVDFLTSVSLDPATPSANLTGAQLRNLTCFNTVSTLHIISFLSFAGSDRACCLRCAVHLQLHCLPACTHSFLRLSSKHRTV